MGVCLVECASSLLVVGNCSDVVIESEEHLALPVIQVVDKVGLDEHSGLLQVTDGEVNSQFFGSHSALLYCMICHLERWFGAT